MNIDFGEMTALVLRHLDRDGSGSLERAELDDFLGVLERSLAETAPGASSTAGRASLLAGLASSDNPAHDFKVLLNDTLVDVSRELGLSLVSIEGARYPAVAELRPAGSEGLTSQQVAIRRSITEELVARLASDPALPEGIRVTVENPEAGSGADKIKLSTESGDELVFDVITGAGILKARIAKNHLAAARGLPVDLVHGAQLDLLGALSARLQRSAQAYRGGLG